MPSCLVSGPFRGAQVAGHSSCTSYKNYLLNPLRVISKCAIMYLCYQETTLNQQEPEQPSPVSVLEPPNEAELSTSECFESISAGLHG